MPRMYNVTSTINTNLIRYIAYDRTAKVLENRTATIKLADDLTDDKELQALRNKVDIEACAILEKETLSALYGMTDEDFYKISFKLEPTDSRRDLITRTLKACMATVMVFDMEAKQQTFKQIPMDMGFEKLSLDKQLAKVRTKLEDGTIVCLAVTECTTREELRGTTKEKFIAKAVLLNPETRQPYDDKESE